MSVITQRDISYKPKWPTAMMVSINTTLHTYMARGVVRLIERQPQAEWHTKLVHKRQYTYMPLLVQLIIRKLQFVEIDDCVHPVATQVWRVRVNVETSWGALLLEALDPGRVLVLVAILINWCHVHEQNVCRVGVKTKQFHFKRWKHSSAVKIKRGKGSSEYNTVLLTIST